MQDLLPLQDVISLDRLSGYRRPDTDDRNALARYAWNTLLGAALYPVLMHLEVALRNRLDLAIQSRYPGGWMNRLHPILLPVEQHRLEVAKRALRSQGESPTHGRLVAQLTFGFWTSLLHRRYEHRQLLWPTLLKAAFPHLPSARRTRAVVFHRFDRIRLLRNRVFHYEPIWHWADLERQHLDIIEALTWLCPDLANLVKETDRFPAIYRGGWLACREEATD